MLSTEQVAERLGVKPATVYAYVSRGLLASRRNADGKGSLFARRDVDAFVARRKRTTTPGTQTGITLIRNGHLYYRGRDAGDLARESTFEAVTTLLWTGSPASEPAPPPARDGDLGERQRAIAARVVDALPASARITDRLRVIVAAVAAADPLRFDTAPVAVMATGRALIDTMVAALPPRLPEDDDAPLAARLWRRLTGRGAAGSGAIASGSAVGSGAIERGSAGRGSAGHGPTASAPTAGEVRLLDAALILLADHDMAASTVAARVAASTRAHPYAVVSAGLAAFDGPLHGGASGLAYALLAEALSENDPVGPIAARLRTGGMVPGFGHSLYPDGDPRAATLMALLGDGPVRDCAERVAGAMRARSGVRPNIDFALATLALEHGMPPDASEAIFAVARTAGWLAHALEEYADRPLRFRPVGMYAGRDPQA
ncbi:citrate synthase [Actinoplanes sp. CA-030573]|uniref:citrate synthase n=1 Tax=Actinoplanes sp. CA-030573 TaxID=3239898 RepID=UPI003D90BAF8